MRSIILPAFLGPRDPGCAAAKKRSHGITRASPLCAYSADVPAGSECFTRLSREFRVCVVLDVAAMSLNYGRLLSEDRVRSEITERAFSVTKLPAVRFHCHRRLSPRKCGLVSMGCKEEHGSEVWNRFRLCAQQCSPARGRQRF
jgi:hypothetical protein